ncbi:hypothetical protein [Cupriavidus taiwanensis]|uniref:hypothetical protein n=1 Tax=Cupriavidus taiwanensis TaxID=164546 RepID=UPI000E10AF68|nr:hypothetical protein [Cupriavidus taiwanensis]SPA50577.1 protein of unknown function [Cupriavidus taiwanensis]
MNTRNQTPVTVLVGPTAIAGSWTHMIRADIPAIRVGDPAWVHEAAKAIALSLTEHFESKEQA